jgi:excinuclease ABC subunit A
VPDPEKSLEKGAIQPWRRAGKRLTIYYKAMLRSAWPRISASAPKLPTRICRTISKRSCCNGSGGDELEFKFWRAGKISKISKRPFEGVLPNLERLANGSESEFIRNRLKAYMTPQFCDACGGRRLKPEILAVTLGGEGRRRFKAGKAKLEIPGLSIMDVCGLVRGKGG